MVWRLCGAIMAGLRLSWLAEGICIGVAGKHPVRTD